MPSQADAKPPGMVQSAPQGLPWQGGGGQVTAPVTQLPAPLHFIASPAPGGVQSSPHALPAQGLPPEPPLPPAPPPLELTDALSLPLHAATKAMAPNKQSHVFKLIAP